jgi:hypothetical protein
MQRFRSRSGKENRMLNRRLLLAAAMLVGVPRAGAAAKPLIKVYKDPYCDCCTAWAEHLEASGFTVTVEAHNDMAAIKRRLGVPEDLASCHTGVVQGYTIEGHVPAEDIKRLVAKRTAAKGLAVPGMPVNSPGMEVPGEADEPYTVWLFQADGARTAFARHGG